jgi:hypothetical protein
MEERPATPPAGPGGQVAEEALFDLPPAELGLEEQEQDLFGLGDGGRPHPQPTGSPPADATSPAVDESTATGPEEGERPAPRPRGFRGWLARLFGSES